VLPAVVAAVVLRVMLKTTLLFAVLVVACTNETTNVYPVVLGSTEPDAVAIDSGPETRADSGSAKTEQDAAADTADSGNDGAEDLGDAGSDATLDTRLDARAETQPPDPCSLCAAPENASPICTDGACSYRCKLGYYRDGGDCKTLEVTNGRLYAQCGSSRWECTNPGLGVEWEPCCVTEGINAGLCSSFIGGECKWPPPAVP
jgi:hypothetical protein